MASIKILLLSVVLYCPRFLFGQDSLVQKLLEGKIPGISIESKPRYFNPKISEDKELQFLRQLKNAGVEINLDSSFYVIDSSNTNYNPKIGAKDWFPMIRSVGDFTDTNYAVGIFAFEDWMTYPKKVALWESEMNTRSIKNKPHLYLSSNQLQKTNALNGHGVIYDLEMSIPFKNKYYKCKVLALESKEYHYIALYYFYNGEEDKKIISTIESQFGIIKFK
ncbi:hypothetical protein [Niabella hirudinis]|uniref:hypothetical protein n=1 Tax=Niabella hirudinis TaxID=1285929 RepID=UPI003EBDE112